MGRRSHVVQTHSATNDVAVPLPPSGGGRLYCAPITAGEFLGGTSPMLGSLPFTAERLTRTYLSATLWGCGPRFPTYTISTDQSFPGRLYTHTVTIASNPAMTGLTATYDVVGEGNFRLRVSVYDPGEIPPAWGDIAEIIVQEQSGPGSTEVDASVQLSAGQLLRFQYIPEVFVTPPSGPTAETSWLQAVIQLSGSGNDQTAAWL